MSDDDTRSESVDMDEMEVELPQPLVDFIGLLEDDQSKLLKQKQVFKDPDQLRKFLAMSIMERFIQLVKMLGTTAFDTHQLSVSNASQLQRQRRWAAEHFRALGLKVSDGEPFPGVGTEVLDEFGEAFFALGTHLQKALPEDQECQALYNRTAEIFRKLIATLMGDQSVTEDEEEEDEEEETEEAETAGEEAPVTDAPSEDSPS